MTQSEFNLKLQEVQHIEVATGVKILTLVERRDKDGHLRGAEWHDADGRSVLTQRWPFTPYTEYYVDEAAWGRIVNSDPTR